MAKNKINQYIISKLTCENPQLELRKKLAERSGKDPDFYKGIVSKWFNTDQTPGKEYLLDLSIILGVSVESILLGEDRPMSSERPTAYLAATTGDPVVIDRLFGNMDSDIRVTTTDEYGKCFLDYVIELQNYDALKTAISHGFCPLDRFGHNTGWGLTGEEEYAIAEMVIRADDLEVFRTMFSRMFLPEGSEFGKHCRYLQPPYIPSGLIHEILASSKILDYMITPRPFDKEEWALVYVNWEVLLKPGHPVDHLPTLCPGYEVFISKAFESGDRELFGRLLHVARENAEMIRQMIGDEAGDLIVRPDGVLKYRKEHGGVWAFIPHVMCGDDLTEAERADLNILNALLDDLAPGEGDW